MDRRRFLYTTPTAVGAASLLTAPQLFGSAPLVLEAMPAAKIVRPIRRDVYVPGDEPIVQPGIIGSDDSVDHLEEKMIFFGNHQHAKLHQLRGEEVGRLYNRFAGSNLAVILENKAFLLPLPYTRREELEPSVASNFVSIKKSYWLSDIAIRFAGDPSILSEPLSDMYKYGYTYYDGKMLPRLVIGNRFDSAVGRACAILTAAPATTERFHPGLTGAHSPNPHCYKHVTAYVPQEHPLRFLSRRSDIYLQMHGAIDLYGGFCLTNRNPCSVGNPNVKIWLREDSILTKVPHEQALKLPGSGGIDHYLRPTSSVPNHPRYIDEDDMKEHEEAEAQARLEQIRRINQEPVWQPEVKSDIIEIVFSDGRPAGRTF